MKHSVYQCLYMFCQLFLYFKVQVLSLIQQPGLYWDSPSAYPLVGVRPTQMLHAMSLRSLSLCIIITHLCSVLVYCSLPVICQDWGPSLACGWGVRSSACLKSLKLSSTLYTSAVRNYLIAQRTQMIILLE